MTPPAGTLAGKANAAETVRPLAVVAVTVFRLAAAWATRTGSASKAASEIPASDARPRPVSTRRRAGDRR